MKQNILDVFKVDCCNEFSKPEKEISCSTHILESVFIEINKSTIKSKRNVLIDEIYRPPSSNKNTLNIELDFFKLKDKKNMHF